MARNCYDITIWNASSQDARLIRRPKIVAMTHLRDWSVPIFATLGPPLGSMILLLVTLLSENREDITYPNTAYHYIELMFAGIIYSYVLGLVPALLTGFIVEWIRDIGSKNEFLLVLATGTIIGTIYTTFIFIIGGKWKFEIELIYFFAVCFVPTLICWLIVCFIEQCRDHYVEPPLN